MALYSRSISPFPDSKMPGDYFLSHNPHYLYLQNVGQPNNVQDLEVLDRFASSLYRDIINRYILLDADNFVYTDNDLIRNLSDEDLGLLFNDLRYNADRFTIGGLGNNALNLLYTDVHSEFEKRIIHHKWTPTNIRTLFNLKDIDGDEDVNGILTLIEDTFVNEYVPSDTPIIYLNSENVRNRHGNYVNYIKEFVLDKLMLYDRFNLELTFTIENGNKLTHPVIRLSSDKNLGRYFRVALDRVDVYEIYKHILDDKLPLSLKSDNNGNIWISYGENPISKLMGMNASGYHVETGTYYCDIKLDLKIFQFISKLFVKNGSITYLRI